MSELDFAVGSLVRVRGREWVVQPGSAATCLRLRPMSGAEADECVVLPDLEFEPPLPASFDLPDPNSAGSAAQTALLRDALQLKLRNGAGPFRSFGNIAVEPRAYQLVPLLMALKQKVVRLLIADDVGVGKTIEAGLILRELLDRDEIARAAILCPPHLVDQWERELRQRFNIRAATLTATSAARMERAIPAGESLFAHYPFIIVSLDYIKNPRHRDNFLNIAPECIVVDEAHTCTQLGQGQQFRWELINVLSQASERHLILLTATPHSGNELGFFNLLSLLNPAFSELQLTEDKALREHLADHFVQRRRIDIAEWHDHTIFPRRLTSEVTYALSGEWLDFFNRIHDYCGDLATRKVAEGRAGAMIWYATLALLRCAASSPAAAIKALSARLRSTTEELTAEEWDTSRIYDDPGIETPGSDLEPEIPALTETTSLRALIKEAEKLVSAQDDPKLQKLVAILKTMLKDGYYPVVFCRYIATANYVADALAKALPKTTIRAVTGAAPPDARDLMVQELAENPSRILVCTDCLSEGINLQDHFDAVVHYDLAWNPTRHEQREGRVDRYGQTTKEVRCALLYGQDNPVDGLVLKVILRKAEAIRKELGVSVPVPLDDQRVSQAMVKAVLLKRQAGAGRQLDLFEDLSGREELQTLELNWTNAFDKERKNRTIFAQRGLKPADVLPEWEKTTAILGDTAAVERFVGVACAALNAPLAPTSKKSAYRFTPQHLHPILQERLAEANINTDKSRLITFHSLPLANVEFIHRSHPLVSSLADFVLETAISDTAPNGMLPASRCAVTPTDAVTKKSVLLILRLRHRLQSLRKGETKILVAEETLALAAAGTLEPRWLSAAETAALFDVVPAANLSANAIAHNLQAAYSFIHEQQPYLEKIATNRAETLLADHRRVRDAASAQGTYSVSPVLPVDIMGVYVLLPNTI